MFTLFLYLVSVIVLTPKFSQSSLFSTNTNLNIQLLTIPIIVPVFKSNIFIRNDTIQFQMDLAEPKVSVYVHEFCKLHNLDADDCKKRVFHWALTCQYEERKRTINGEHFYSPQSLIFSSSLFISCQIYHGPICNMSKSINIFMQ
jgi:hypothetical protein